MEWEDAFMVPDRLKESLTDGEIHAGIMGSDHCPVALELTIKPAMGAGFFVLFIAKSLAKLN